MKQIYEEDAPSFLVEMPAVDVLRRVWIQQYQIVNEQLVWRADKNTPPKRLLVQSPYDTEARNSTKRNVNWTGYKVHLTETCDEETPNIITNVETTPATTTDVGVIDDIHANLADKELMPTAHFVDAGYTSASKILKSQEKHEIELVVPVAVGKRVLEMGLTQPVSS